MKRSKYVKLNNFWCKICHQTKISLHRHDFAVCACGNFVDGGFDYCRKGGKFEDMRELPLYWKRENKNAKKI